MQQIQAVTWMEQKVWFAPMLFNAGKVKKNKESSHFLLKMLQMITKLVWKAHLLGEPVTAEPLRGSVSTHGGLCAFFEPSKITSINHVIKKLSQKNKK